MGRPRRFSPEVRERAIRLVMEQRSAHPSEWAALQAVARIDYEPSSLIRTGTTTGGRSGSGREDHRR